MKNFWLNHFLAIRLNVHLNPFLIPPALSSRVIFICDFLKSPLSISLLHPSCMYVAIILIFTRWTFFWTSVQFLYVGTCNTKKWKFSWNLLQINEIEGQINFIAKTIRKSPTQIFLFNKFFTKLILKKLKFVWKWGRILHSWMKSICLNWKQLTVNPRKCYRLPKFTFCSVFKEIFFPVATFLKFARTSFVLSRECFQYFLRPVQTEIMSFAFV